jgi:hypothetical protein
MKCRSNAKSREEEYPTNKKRREANWIVYVYRRNCLLQRVIERNIQGRVEVTGRGARRCKQLLGDLRAKKRYCKFK